MTTQIYVYGSGECDQLGKYPYTRHNNLPTHAPKPATLPSALVGTCADLPYAHLTAFNLF